MTFLIGLRNFLLEETVPQIFYLGPSFYFMTKDM